MAYENDIIMRQVRDMTRMLAKILFGKNTATYEYKEEDRHTATDSFCLLYTSDAADEL